MERNDPLITSLSVLAHFLVVNPRCSSIAREIFMEIQQTDRKRSETLALLDAMMHSILYKIMIVHVYIEEK